MSQRAIGIVRVSRTRGREGETFASPREQADRIRAECERTGLGLLRIEEELDVSGGKPLDQRPGLGPAVRAVEAGDADVIVGAYFDRLFRSLTAQAEAVERVEHAGGRVLAVDVGHVSTGSAGQWLSGTMMGAVAEYQRRTTVERVRGAVASALARGVAPYGRVPAGYRKRADGVFEPDPKRGPVVRAAFEQRAAGATVDDVWRHLAAHGIEVTYSAVYQLLQSRVYLGELHFGKFPPNLTAHEALVDRGTWEAVQRTRSPSGRKPKSARLLARLGILRCGSCGSRMAGSTATGATSRGGGGGRTYPIYRCGNKACDQPVSISAERVERAVVDRVTVAFADVEGRASAEATVAAAERELEQAQSELDAAIRVLRVVGDEPVAISRLAGLRDARDRAQAEVDKLGGLGTAKSIRLARDWALLTLQEQRAAITATVDRVTVAPGRGADRVAVHLFGE